jgi:hypothetical protein
VTCPTSGPEAPSSEPAEVALPGPSAAWSGPPGFLALRRVRSALGSLAITFPATAAACGLGLLPWLALGLPPALSGAALAWLWLEARRWPRYLPFALKGLWQVEGSAPRCEDWQPLVAFCVRLVPAGPVTDPAPLHEALATLAARAHRVTLRSAELRRQAEPPWRREGLTLSGRSHLGLYTDEVLARWIRDDLRRLHRRAPLAEVEVRAAFTSDQVYFPASGR